MAQELKAPRAFGRQQKSEGPEIPNVTDGYYRVVVKDVKEGVSTYGDNETEQYVIEFELLDFVNAAGKEITLRAYIAIPAGAYEGNLNENSNLYKFITALGYEDEELEIDPGAWQGAELQIHVNNRKIKEGNNAGQTRPRVVGYTRAATDAAPGLQPRGATAAPVSEAAPAAPPARPASVARQQASPAATAPTPINRAAPAGASPAQARGTVPAARPAPRPAASARPVATAAPAAAPDDEDEQF